MLEEILQDYDGGEKYNIDKTTIATDIENKDAGKGLGATKIIEWLREKSLFPQQFHAFGDSRSDRQMADRIHELGYPVELVWSGAKDEFEKHGHPPYPVVIPDGIHDTATANYFKQFLTQEDQK